jgi:hypothetical protein
MRTRRDIKIFQRRSHFCKQWNISRTDFIVKLTQKLLLDIFLKDASLDFERGIIAVSRLSGYFIFLV